MTHNRQPSGDIPERSAQTGDFGLAELGRVRLMKSPREHDINGVPTILLCQATIAAELKANQRYADGFELGGLDGAGGARLGGADLHGLAHRAARDARPAAGRREDSAQRRRACH